MWPSLDWFDSASGFDGAHDSWDGTLCGVILISLCLLAAHVRASFDFCFFFCTGKRSRNKTYIFFSEARKGSLAAAYISIGSACNQTYGRTCIMISIADSLLGSTSLTIPSEGGDHIMREKRRRKKGGQKILETCRVPKSGVPNHLHQCNPVATRT